MFNKAMPSRHSKRPPTKFSLSNHNIPHPPLLSLLLPRPPPPLPIDPRHHRQQRQRNRTDKVNPPKIAKHDPCSPFAICIKCDEISPQERGYKCCGEEEHGHRGDGAHGGAVLACRVRDAVGCDAVAVGEKVVSLIRTLVGSA